MQLSEMPKARTAPVLYRQRALEIFADYSRYTCYFTDGSKDGENVGSAFVVDGDAHHFRLPLSCSVYTAELYAISQVLLHISSTRSLRILICSDSKSALESIGSFSPDHPLVQEIQCQLYALTRLRRIITFCWVPGHVGLRGNELADAAARAASVSPDISPCRVPAIDVKAFLRLRVLSSWSNDWSNVCDNKLRNIKDTVSPWVSSCRSNRRESVIVTRLRIGHSLLTHGFLLCGEDPPLCTRCAVQLSVQHILISCPQHEGVRRRYRLHGNLADVLRDDPEGICNVLSFLTEIGMCRFF